MLKRRDLTWLWFLLAGALVGLYGVYWKIVHDQAIAILDDQIDGWQAAGYAVSWTKFESGGFPFAIEAHFYNPAVTSPPDSDPWSWRGESVRISLRPWALNTLTVRPSGPQSATTRDYGVVDAEAANLVITMSSDAVGLRRADVTSDHLAAVRRVSGETLFAAESLAAHIERQPEEPGLFHLIGELIRPEWADANDAAPEAARLQAELSEGDVLIAQRDLDARALAAWSEAGGRISLEDARLEWPDDSALGASGVFNVGRAGFWDGRVTLDTHAPSRAFAKLAALGLVDAQAAYQAGVVADAVATDGSARVTLTMRDGGVYLLGARLGQAPRAF